MRALKIAAVEIIGIMLLASVAAAQAVTPAASKGQITTTTTRRTDASGAQSMIHGKVVDVNLNPMPNVPVRLRNLRSARVEQRSLANQAGEFTFTTQPDVPYVVEIADQGGRIIAVGDVVVAHMGEVASTIVAIPARVPALAGVFGETLGSVISAVAGTGITALQLTATDPPPASPEQ